MAEERAGGQTDAHAHALIERFGKQMLATARRYSDGLDDAEDAFQRAAEIALRHSPTGSDAELLRWLRTTVKREALAIAHGRSRVVAAGGPERLPEPRGTTAFGGGTLAPGAVHERSERLERLRHGGEALRRLKPQEIRCMVLLAEGYSYAEICEQTGFSYTKVNRCLSEGRQAFLQHLRNIESGAECRRLAPLLSAFADGELGAGTRDEERTPNGTGAADLRAHLGTCLACRARLREYRAAPARVAALAPLSTLAGDPGSLAPGGGTLRSLLESVAGAVQERWTALTSAAGERVHQAAEMAAGQKAAAIAASAAAIAGGGAMTSDRLQLPDRPAVQERPAADRTTIDQAPPAPLPSAPSPAPQSEIDAESDKRLSDVSPAPVPASSGEFGPEENGAASPPSSQTPASTPASSPSPPTLSSTEPGEFER